MKPFSSPASAAMLMLFGLAVSSASGEMMAKDNMMQQDTMTMSKGLTAMLSGADGHHAAGTASITTDHRGKQMLSLSDLEIDKVPDGRVYLAMDGDYRKGIELGKLTRFSGHVEFSIPDGTNVDDYNSVVIWCKKFDVEIGHATFVMMDNDMMGVKKEMMK